MNAKDSAGQRPEREERQRNVASREDVSLTSWRIGALPIINQVFERMRLGDYLETYLRRERRDTKVGAVDGLMVLTRRLLLSPGPLYAVGEWAAHQAWDHLGLEEEQIESLNDDRIGRCLDRLFESDYPSMLLALVGHVIETFDVRMDELHNDSTSINFFGAYRQAREEHEVKGQDRKTLALRRGHSKDHRPDLRQALFILTVTGDGGLPIHFTAASGNVTDDSTHQRTWRLLQELTGRADFLYVADCKLVTVENLKYIDKQGGRFVSVYPRSRKESKAFKDAVLAGGVRKRKVREYPRPDGQTETFSTARFPSVTQEGGFPIHWFHSSHKALLDRRSRNLRVSQAINELMELSDRLLSPRTRYTDRARVDRAIEKILKKRKAHGLVDFEIDEETEDVPKRRARRGRPRKGDSPETVQRTRFELSCWVNDDAINADARFDGYFPLVTNDPKLRPVEVLEAHKGQIHVERRFNQLKTDFEVAPAYLKSATRIESLLCVYFLALLTQALIERELRQAMARNEHISLPLYHESRDCKAPTAPRLFELFDNLLRHRLVQQDQPSTHLATELSPIQRQVLDLLEVPSDRFH